MSFVVFTSDGYVDLVHGFAYFFNKYWDSKQKVNVLGFKPPKNKLPSNFEFISAGNQSDFSKKDFCGPFRPIIEELPGTTITYFIEDTFIIAPVRTQLYEAAKKQILNNEAEKVELFWGGKPQYSVTRPWPKNNNFREYPQNARYRCNISPAVINKEYFLHYFVDGYSLQEYEVKNFLKSRHDGATILIGEEPIAPWYNVIRDGTFNLKDWKHVEESEDNSFAWNKYQKIACEDFEMMLEYKDWSPYRD